MDEAAWDAAAALHDTALARLDVGDVVGAESVARKAVAALELTVGLCHPDAANARATLARIRILQGRYSEGAALARGAVEALAAFGREPSIDAIRRGAFEELGTACISLGAYTEAEAALASALALARGDKTADLAAASIQSARGVLCKLLGRYDEAARAYDDARRRYEKAGVPLPPSLAHNLAGLACARRDFLGAESLARSAVEQRRGLESEGFALAQDLVGLADALAGQRRTAEAEALYREGLETLRRHDPGHPEVGYALHNLADALAEAGRAAEAESMYLEAIAHKGGAMGEDHHEVAASRANLAALLASCGRRDEAYLLAQGAAARTEHLPSSHPVRVGCEAVAARLKPRAVPRVSESPSDSSSTQ